MDAGSHVSAVFTPFEPPSMWHYDYGRFAFRVPDGWDNLEDGKDDYILATTNAPPDTDILLIAGVAPHVQDAACSQLAPPEPGVGTSPQAIARWIGTIPGLITTKPTPTDVGGLPGVTLDVSVSPTSTHTCPFSEGRAGAQLFSPSDSEVRVRLWHLGHRANAAGSPRSRTEPYVDGRHRSAGQGNVGCARAGRYADRRDVPIPALVMSRTSGLERLAD